MSAFNIVPTYLLTVFGIDVQKFGHGEAQFKVQFSTQLDTF